MPFLKQKNISPNLIAITENLSPIWTYVMFLVLGEDAAALVDSGVGLIPNLPELIRSHSEKPLSVLITHSDPDHVGGALLFDEKQVFLPEQDLAAYANAISPLYRNSCITRMFSPGDPRLALGLETIVPTVPQIPTTFTHGHRFELGGSSLEAFHLPGHTKGSHCFINDNEGYALVGDAITKIPLVSFPRCTSLERYYLALREFHARTLGMALYCGHSVSPIHDPVVEDIIAGCEEILAGQIENDPFDKYHITPEAACDGFRPRTHKYRSAIIRYNADKIHIEDEAKQIIRLAYNRKKTEK